MRIEIQTTLVNVPSAEDNELNVFFDVTASATVRGHGHTETEPGELLVEDIEIDAVRSYSISYGRFGQVIPGDTPFSGMRAIENQRRLDWLNSVLDDRDDWTDAIRAKVIAEHAKQEAVLV